MGSLVTGVVGVFWGLETLGPWGERCPLLPGLPEGSPCHPTPRGWTGKGKGGKRTCASIDGGCPAKVRQETSRTSRNRASRKMTCC